MLVDEQQKRAERVDHGAAFEIQRAIQKSQAVRVTRLAFQSKASHPVGAPLVIVLLLARNPQYSVANSRAGSNRRPFVVRHLRRQYAFDGIPEDGRRCSVRQHVTRQALPVQGFGHVETLGVFQRVLHDEQLASNDVVIRSAEVTVVPDQRQNNL